LTALLVTGACVVLTVTSPASADRGADRGEVYLRAGAPVVARVHDLVRRMSLDEKVGQLEQIAVNRLLGDCNWNGGAFNDACMKQVLADEATGSILSGGGMGPVSNTPRTGPS
jgi:beta-glucosidase